MMNSLVLVTAVTILLGCTAHVKAQNDIPTLVKNLGLSTLYSLVVKEGLAPTLSSPGPFTVFGPTNDAFANLPKWASKLNDSVLVEVLKYHVLKGKVFSSAIKDELTVPTVQGANLRFNIYPNGVITAQCAPIDLDKVNQNATNGVVHVLNAVMIPPLEGNIVQTLAKCPAFTTLVTAVKAAGLIPALSGAGPFTLFAPTNDAFAKLPPGALDNLLKNTTALANVLKYHVTEKTYCSAGLASGTVTTLNGQDVTVKVEGGTVTVNNAKVTAADGSVSNGVVHAIDTVLLPTSM